MVPLAGTGTHEPLWHHCPPAAPLQHVLSWAASATHTPPLQVWQAGQPQLSVPPQPSGMLPHRVPWAAQLVGLQPGPGGGGGGGGGGASGGGGGDGHRVLGEHLAGAVLTAHRLAEIGAAVAVLGATLSQLLAAAAADALLAVACAVVGVLPAGVVRALAVAAWVLDRRLVPLRGGGVGGVLAPLVLVARAALPVVALLLLLVAVLGSSGRGLKEAEQTEGSPSRAASVPRRVLDADRFQVRVSNWSASIATILREPEIRGGGGSAPGRRRVAIVGCSGTGFCCHMLAHTLVRSDTS
jgi:hypothetical protein